MSSQHSAAVIIAPDALCMAYCCDRDVSGVNCHIYGCKAIYNRSSSTTEVLQWLNGCHQGWISIVCHRTVIEFPLNGWCNKLPPKLLIIQIIGSVRASCEFWVQIINFYLIWQSLKMQPSEETHDTSRLWVRACQTCKTQGIMRYTWQYIQGHAYHKRSCKGKS